MLHLKPLGETLLLLSFISNATSTEVRLDTSRTNKGPLTTTFTPPPSCLNDVRSRTLHHYPELELGCEGPGGNECCPEGWATNRYFSPGVCPSGYEACTLPTSRQREETTNICCPSYVPLRDPSGISPFPPHANLCATRNFNCPPVYYGEYGECDSLLNTPRTIPYTSEGTPTDETVYRVYATPIQVRFKREDSPVVPIPTASFDLPPPKQELSSGVKAGIGVGVTVGIVGLITLLVLLIHRQRAHRHAAMLSSVTLLGAQNAPEEPPPPYMKR